MSSDFLSKESVMIPNNRVSAVLCSTDLARSQEFYEKRVGLKLSTETIKNHLVFECGDGTTLLLYGRPSPNKADHTQVRFWSTDIAADVQELAARGVEFDHLEFGDLKMVDHVLTSPGIGKSAWFKDPDGNTLAVFQPE
jgi:catechol 2,3-dioxygenase-like lactoylglutathione lyase family enzyme